MLHFARKFNTKTLNQRMCSSDTRKYLKSHEWVTLSQDKTIATVGITDFAQHELGDVVYVELPEVGAEYKHNDVFAVVESVKAASDIMLPMSGTVEKSNLELESSPQLLNSSPYKDGWMVKIRVSDPNEWQSLMDEKEYAAHVAASSHE